MAEGNAAARTSQFINISQPEPMSMDGDIGENWKEFRSAFDIFIIASRVSGAEADVKAALLLHCIGKEGREALKAEELSDAEKANYALLVPKLEEHFLPKSNVSVETYKFNARMQLPGESFDSFLVDLRKMAASCDFGVVKDRLIRDRIVNEIKDKKVQDRLLRESNLTLQKAVEMFKAAECTEMHIKKLAEKIKTTEVNVINKGSKKQHSSQKSMGSRGTVQGQSSSRKMNNENEAPRKQCGRCGRQHQYGRCPAFGQTCMNCKGFNHFAAVCKTKTVHQVDSKDGK